MSKTIKGNRYFYNLLNEGIFDFTRLSKELDKLIDTRYGFGNAKDKSYANMKRNPLLLKDMDKFLIEVKKIRDEKKKVIIFGDYDVDGITGATVLIKGLRAFGVEKENIDYILPDRDIGYSIHKEYIEKYLANPARRLKHIDYIITVDCGTNSVDEINKIVTQMGIPVGVSDHHHITVDLKDSKASFIINQHRKDDSFPFKQISGSFIALKMMEAIKNKYMILPNVTNVDNLMSELEDVAALGAIADVMPVLDENFFLIRDSLNRFYQSKNPAIRYMSKTLGKKKDLGIDTTIVGFGIGPRLNAGGRLESAEHGLKMLLVSDETDKVKMNDLDNERIIKNLFEDLDAINERRKSMVEETMKTVPEKANYDAHKGAVFCDRNIPDGIIGLVAGRLKEKVLKPSICITVKVANALLLAEESAKESRDDTVLDSILLHPRADLMGKDHLVRRKMDLIRQGKTRTAIDEKTFYTKMATIAKFYPNETAYEAVIKLQDPNVLVEGYPVLMHAIENGHTDVAVLLSSFDKTDVNADFIITAKCSGRSIETVNLIEIIHELADYFVGYGGHDYAFGGTLKKETVNAFIQAFYKVCDKKISDKDLMLESEIFAEVDGNDFHKVLPRIMQSLALFGPFGKNREMPKILYTGTVFKIEESTNKSTGKTHTYLYLNESTEAKCAFWNTTIAEVKIGNKQIKSGDKVSIIGDISVFPKNGGGYSYTVSVSDIVSVSVSEIPLEASEDKKPFFLKTNINDKVWDIDNMK